MALPSLPLNRIQRQPFHYHISALDSNYPGMSEVALAYQTATGGEFPSEGYLSFVLDIENSQTQRILFIPWQSEFVNSLLSSNDPKADVLQEVGRQGRDVVIGEWPGGSHSQDIVFYTVPAVDLLQAYHK